MSEWRRALTDRLAGLTLRPEREAEIIDELVQHLDDQVRERIDGGATLDAARAEALAELDAPGELARRLAAIEQRPPLALPAPGAPSRGRWFQARWQDVRHSLRSLSRAPIFTTTVVLTFALTIGPTTAILTVGNWLLWRPTPGVTDARQLGVMWTGEWRENANGVSVSGVSYANLDELRRASKTISGFAGVQEGGVSLAAPGHAPAVVSSSWVTANTFEVLGVPFVAGRPFRADEDRESDGAQVAVVSESFAREGFGGAERAVNQTIYLNGRSMTIVGVAAERFAGISPLSRVIVWYPATAYGYVNHATVPINQTRADGIFYTFVVRLAPGATFQTAQAELDVIVPALAESHPEDNEKFRNVRARLYEGLGPMELQRKRYAELVRVLLAIGGALLLLGCANVANVLAVRGVRDVRDRAIRLALGASRARLVALQLTESGLLAAGGGLLGLLFAVWLKQLIVTLLFPGVQDTHLQVSLDLRVLGVTMTVSLVCGLVAGLAPALVQRHTGLAMSIAAGGGRSVTSGRWLRAGFAGVQLALSLALVTGSLLLAATLRNLHAVDLGFDPENVTRHIIDPARHGYKPDRTLVYFQDLVSRLKGRPGIEAVSVSGLTPFSSSHTVRVQDPAGADRPPISVRSNNINPSYFETLRMPIVRGRTFTDAEALTPAGATALPVVIGENLAKRLFGTIEAAGRSFVLPRAGNNPTRAALVVGVVGDVYWNSLTDERPLLLYQPYPQMLAVASLWSDRRCRRSTSRAWSSPLRAKWTVPFRCPCLSR
jgi:predicted permease